MDNLGYVQDTVDPSKPYIINRNQGNQNGSKSNDYLVEVSSKAKLLKSTSTYKRLSLALFILFLIVLIAFIILIVLYFQRTKLCTTSKCLKTAANLRYSLDFTQDPCEDFYKYTCGNWDKDHTNPGWFHSFSTFTTINEKLFVEIINFLMTPPQEEEPLALNKTRNLFQSCMDITAKDQLGLSIVYKYLKQLNLPIVPSLITLPEDQRHQFTFNWVKTEVDIKKLFSMDVFIGLGVTNNIYNRSENVIYVGTPGQVSPLPRPIKAKAQEEERSEAIRIIRTRIVTFVLEVIRKNNSLPEPSLAVLEEASSVINNISNIVEELSTNYTSDSPGDIVINKTIQELDSFTDPQFHNFWSIYINNMFENTGVIIEPNKDRFYLFEKEALYLPKILEFLNETPDIYIELYMWWVTVNTLIINTHSEIIDYISKQTSVLYSSSVIRTREMECAELVNGFMSLAVTYAIADKDFLNTTKPKVEQMLNEIKDAFMETVNSITWMDRETKKATLEKSKEMISFIGYPEWLFKNDSLDKYYEEVEIDPTMFLENLMGMVKKRFPEKLRSLRNLTERDWSTDPIDVNAFNSFTDNAINVPMAILNFPIYDLGIEALNYGSFGTVLGHELTHGFDNTGRKYDKYGNYIQWWSNQTGETFENMTQCFINQYSNFTLYGENIKGLNTLGENIADNGGLHQSFLAYKKHLQLLREEEKLPGFENFTNYQMFFIGYGSIWCETVSEEGIKNQILTDEHSPNKIRVLGGVQNSKEFSEAFQCPLGSKMNPPQKCKIW